MNYNKVDTTLNTDRLIDKSKNVLDLHFNSETSYFSHRDHQEPSISSTQALINDSKSLIAQAEKIMSDYKSMYSRSN